jgi:hypothetical protein
MTATALLADFRAKDMRLTVQGHHLSVHAPKGMMSEALRATIRRQKTALLALLTVPPASAPGAISSVWSAWPQCLCPCCGTARFWQAIYGVRICARCHPPAAPGLVAGWEQGEGLV